MTDLILCSMDGRHTLTEEEESRLALTKSRLMFATRRAIEKALRLHSEAEQEVKRSKEAQDEWVAARTRALLHSRRFLRNNFGTPPKPPSEEKKEEKDGAAAAAKNGNEMMMVPSGAKPSLSSRLLILIGVKKRPAPMPLRTPTPPPLSPLQLLLMPPPKPGKAVPPPILRRGFLRRIVVDRVGGTLQQRFDVKLVAKAAKRAEQRAKKELRDSYLSKEELHLLAVEKELVGKMNPLQAHLYNKMLNPLEELKKGLKQQRYLPGDIVWAVHFVVLAIGLFCTLYIFLFSVKLNTCAGCDPIGESGDDDDEEEAVLGDDDTTPAPTVPDDDFASIVLIWEAIAAMLGVETGDGESGAATDDSSTPAPVPLDDDPETCAGCPDALRTGGEGNAGADWLVTLTYTLLFNLLIAEPYKLLKKKALQPAVANVLVGVNWARFLVAPKADGGEESDADSSDDDDDDNDDDKNKSKKQEQQKLKETDGEGHERKKKPSSGGAFVGRGALEGVTVGRNQKGARIHMNEAGRVMTREELAAAIDVATKRARARALYLLTGRVDEDDAKATKKKTKGEKGTRQHQVFFSGGFEETKGHDPFDVGEGEEEDSNLDEAKDKKKGVENGNKDAESQSQSRPEESKSPLPQKNDATKDQYEQARWECACGFVGAEGDRRAHLRSCGAFKASWRSAVESTAAMVLESSRRKLREEEEREEGREQESEHEGGHQGDDKYGGEVTEDGGTPGKFQALQESVEELERILLLAAVSEEANDEATEEASTIGTLKTATPPFWTRGMLLAALVESGGQVSAAAAKLLPPRKTSKRRKKKRKKGLSAETYRSEMAFAAEATGIEASLFPSAARLPPLPIAPRPPAVAWEDEEDQGEGEEEEEGK